MKFSYNWLKEFLPKIPKPEELAELLTLHSFEVKEVKKMGNDSLLDIDVLPNRGPDCFSHIGIAREIAAITNSKFQTPKYKIQDTEYKAKDFIKIEVKNKDACPRYTARVVFDVKVGQSPKFIQERLKICGLRPINNIVDIANYVMLETGQPLHAFDFSKIESVNPKSQIPNPKQIQSSKFKNKKLIVRFARKGEKIITLDEEKYDLDSDVLVIADSKKPVAIAGIKGGKDTGIDKKTKIVVLESANFNPGIIRRGSQKLNLKTDASLRFEHGIDPNLTEIAINRAASLIQKIASGKVAQGSVDFYPHYQKFGVGAGPKKVLPKRIKLDLDYLERLLGVKISLTEIKNILKKLQFQLLGITSRVMKVEVPTFRLDISLPEDLVEEVGRVYGYEKIPASFPQATLIPPKRNLDIFWEEISRNSLKEAGFTEIYNYSFLSQSQKEIFNFEDIIEIENPVSIEQKYLRPSLIPNLLKNVRDNLRYFEEIKIFELGKIYLPKNREKRMLSGLIAKKEGLGTAGFYQLKGVIDSLLNKMGISNIYYDDYEPTPEQSKISIWQIKKSAEIKVNGSEIGFLGQISPKILENLKISGICFLFDLDFEKLSQLASEEQEFRPISRYPAAVRDIAILVPREVRVEEVLNKIEISGGNLVRDVDLFDIYEGEELPEGKKNLAFHIIFQAEDRTLSAKEIDQIQKKIIKSLEEELEWQVRK